MNLRNVLFVIVIFMFTSVLFVKPLNLVTFEYPPYEYTQNAELKGMAVDIVKLVFKEMEQPITIEVLPWARAISYIKEGKRDAIFTAFKNPQREKFADYSTVLIPQVVSLFVRKDFSLEYNGDLNKISDVRIGVVRKVSYGKLFDKAVSDKLLKKIEPVNDGTQNFRRLLSGRIDVVVSNTDGAFFILNQLNQAHNISELSPKLQAVPSYMAFSKKRNLLEIRDKFDFILNKLKKDGTYRKIIESYSKKIVLK